MSAAKRGWLKNISGVFTELRRTEKWGRHLSGNLAFRVWEDVVGAAAAKVARPVSLSRGILRVEVSDPAWMQELHMMRADLLEKLNESTGNRKIKEIQFQAGRGERGDKEIDRGDYSGYPYRSLSPEAAVSPDDEIAVRDAVGRVEDPELRHSVEHLMERVRRRTSEADSKNSVKEKDSE